MPIDWRPDTRELHLHNDRVSYLMRVLDDGSLGHVHFGAPLAARRSYGHLPPTEFTGFANRVGTPVPLECPTPSIGDFRPPAVRVRLPDGSDVLHLAYAGHETSRGKPELDGLPATYAEDPAEADCLVVRLADQQAGIEVVVSYTIFEGVPAIARSMSITNRGQTGVRLESAMSASIDLPDAAWNLVHLSGAWASERQVVTRPLAPGRQGIASQRGASSHHHNPFLALARSSTGEADGEVLGLSLVYSGNFLAEAEVEMSGATRARIGIEPETFSWLLEPGATFQAPEAVLVWSDTGWGGLSNAYHELYGRRLARGPWRDRERPVLLNSWEAAYFDFDEAKLLSIATAARDLGVELFVLDDGWFGERDGDTSSLGDWFSDRRKLPDGVDGLARKVVDLGISFGLWIEPEMISERSRLFAEHPDWAVGVPGRPRTPSRSQLVLDMTRPEVVDHLFGRLSGILSSGPISYVKWDMNRSITEPYSVALPPDRQGEFFHRYILGVYDLYRRLTAAFPDVLFESCAGGGGRFDPGLLAFAPQGWTSDNTDAVERLTIQWGTSLVYPISSMGAHVSAVPNHQVGRITPLATRAAVAFWGAFGYELDPRSLSDGEKADVREQIAFYRAWRGVFQFGRFVRLRSPYEADGNETAWMSVAEDESRAVAGWFRVHRRPVPGPNRLRLRGLDPRAVYRVSEWRSDAAPIARGGDDLMGVGLDLTEGPDGRDYLARVFLLERE